MDLKDIWSSLNVDQAYSWCHVLEYYFFNIVPFLVFVPERFYKTTFAALGVVTICHACLNFSRFLTNKKNISDRKERLRLNIAEFKEALKNSKVKDLKNAGLTDLSFDELSAKLKDNTVDQDTLLLAFRKKALETGKFNAVTEYILSSTLMSVATSQGEGETINTLSGIPVSISEAFEISEKDRTLGLGGFVGSSATADALIVKTLKAAGAVPFIRTNNAQALPFCLGLGSSNPIFGRTLNPLAASRSAGGGSCGEACALALNISTLGVGADLAGGTRSPAHFCGVAALRPTAHRLSVQGLIQGQCEVPASVSPMSREVSGLVAFMRAACGPPQAELDPYMPQISFDEKLFSSSKPLRIGFYTDDGCTRTTPPVHRAILDAKKQLEKKGHKLVQFEPPDMKHMLANLLYPATRGSNCVLWHFLSQDVVDVSIRDFYYTTRVSKALRWIVCWWRHAQSPMEEAIEVSAVPVTMSDWWHLKNDIQEFRQTYFARWRRARLDALLCPVFPCAAVNLANEKRFLACLTHVGLFSLLNYPAGTVPITRVQKNDLAQFQRDMFRAATPLEKLMTQDQVGDETSVEESAVGLPIGVQVAALPFHEETVLRVMVELEQGRQRSFSEQGRRPSLLGLESTRSKAQFGSGLTWSDGNSSDPKSSEDKSDQSRMPGSVSEDQDGQPDSSTSVTKPESEVRRSGTKVVSDSKAGSPLGRKKNKSRINEKIFWSQHGVKFWRT